MKTILLWKRILLILIFLTSIAKLQAQFSGTYSIGPNSEYTTISSAIDTLKKVGVSGPTIFEIDSATYIEYVTFTEIPGASETNRITFKAKNDSVNDVRIVEVVNFYGSDYITLKSLHIENNYYNCIRISNGANHITLEDCILKNAEINTNNRVYDVIAGDNFSDDSYTTIRNCKIYNGSCGVFLQGLTAAGEKGHIIENNEFYGSYVHNIGVVRVDSATIEGNTVISSSNSIHNHACGIHVNTSLNTIVKNNKVFVNKHGIRLHNLANSADTTRVFNNMITCKYSGSGFSAFPLYITGGNQNLKVYNNSFYNEYPASIGAVCAEAYYNDAHLDFINNNFISKGYYIARFNNSHTKYTISYNNFNNVGGASNLWMEGSYFESIEEAADVLGENNVSVNPMFTGNEDLHVNNALLGNLGIPLAEITCDIDGDIRNLSNPDIGADEFDPVLGIDLTILQANLDNFPHCQVPESINCTVKNIGNNEVVNFSVVRYLNTVAVDTLTWNGNLGSYETADLSISYHDFHDGDTVDLKIINLNGGDDENTLNNSYTFDGVWLAQSGDIIVADSVEGYPTINEAINILAERGICGDVNIFLKPGVYNNIIDIYEIAGASESAQITIQSETGNPEDVIIAPLVCDNAVIKIDGADYLTIKNITIKADTLNCDGILFVGEATHNTFENLIIYADVKGNQNGIYSSNSDDHNVTIRGCAIYNGNYAIEIKGDKGEDNILIENNLLTGKIRNAAFYCDYAKNIKIRNNKVVIDSTHSVSGFEIYDVYGNLEFTNNEVYIDSTDQVGADFEYFYGVNAQKSLIANNIFSLGGRSWAAVYLYETPNTNFYNNTVISSSPSSSDCALYIDYGSSVDVKNNNIVAKNNATAMHLYNSPIGIIGSDYNNIFATGSSLIRIGNVYIENLTGWQEYGWDVNSLSIDPEFHDVYKTCNASLNNKGISTNGLVIFDIDGNLRNPQTPDIGASEFDFFTPNMIGNDFIFCDTSYILNAGIGATSYSWNTGDTAQNIVITSPGIYTVTIEGMCGISGVDTIEILSGEIKSDFNIESTEYSVKLFDQSTGIIDSYLWQIGDYSSTNKNESLILENDGIYSIHFEVSNTCKTAYKDTTVCIEDFKFLSNALLLDDFLLCDTIVTLDAGPGAYAYLWNTGDTTQLLNITSAGEYYVNVSSLCGLVASDTIMALSSEIKPDFEIVVNDRTLELAEKSTGTIDSYLWSIGDYSSTNRNETVTFNKDGNYTVRLEISNTCSYVEKDTTVCLEKFEFTSNGFLSNDFLLCDSLVTLDAGSGAYTYMWNTGDTTQMVNIRTAGKYYVDVMSVCGSMATDTVVALSSDAIPNFNIIVSDHALKLINESTGIIDSYLWTVGDYSSTNKNETFILEEDGVYPVQLKISNTCVVTQKDTTVCIENFKFTNNSFLGDDFLLCGNSSVVDAGSGAFTYLWNTGNTTQTLTIDTPGKYFVDVTGVCGSTAFDTILALSPEIKADFDLIVSEYTVGLINKSQGFINHFLWTIDNYTSFAENEIFTFNSDGNYKISLEVSNVCLSDIVDTTLTIETTGVYELNSVGDQIFPNPANDFVTLRVEGINEFQVAIFGTNGTKVYVNNEFRTGNRLDISNFDPGHYIVKIFNEKVGSITSQLVVVK